MQTLDASFEVATKILTDAQARLSAIKSEEDAKFQIISRILIEALGWSHEDISNERPNENGFSDYLVSDGDHGAFVVEAKKIGVIEVATQSTTKQQYKINGPALKKALTGISQAASYANPLGIQLAILTDGYTWVVFLPYIPGASYQEKQAICFPGFDAILKDYATFYELLSKAECRKNTYKLIFDKVHENRLVQTDTLISPISANEISIEQKSALAFDLERVFSKFFSSLAGDDDPDLLISCFVETRESRVADFSLERITSNVLGNMGPTDKSVDEGLNAVIQQTMEATDGETVFIVGPSGAGKTTFLERFFKRTLSRETRERCLVIHINTVDATGDDTTSISWMTNRIIQLIEAQIFEEGFPTWNDLQGLYQGEYLKRAKGADANLYRRDKDAFKEKFSTYIDEQVEKDREGYMQRLLKDAVNNRRMLPIFVVDNTDEFEPSYKEKVFQYFQSASRSAKHCVLIFPLTDKSAWSFSKTDIYKIYSSKSFFLPTPSPREVFRRRIDYLKDKIKAQTTGKIKAEYFTSQGIRVKITDLEAFASVVENIFVDQDYTAKRLGELANYNMRVTLNLSRRVITSAVMKVDDIIKAFLTGHILTPSVEQFMNALLLGDYSSYKRGDSHEIFPIFEVSSEIRQSPLTNMRILSLLVEAHVHATEDKQRYLSISSIYRYFDLIGYTEMAVERSLMDLLSANLIERYDLSKRDFSQDQLLAISYSGIAHLELAYSNSTYFEQMALTTWITDADRAAKIAGAYKSEEETDAKMKQVRNLFAEYLVQEDQKFCTVPATGEFALQAKLQSDIVGQWRGKERPTTLQPKMGVVADGVIAIVDKFDHDRGFGFIEVPEMRDDAFLHARTLESGGFEDVWDGDRILCEISRNAKGLYVSKVHSLEPARKEIFTGQIVRLFPDRQYGFVEMPEFGSNAFFHLSVMPPDRRSALEEGMLLTYEAVSDLSGKLQVRRVLDEAPSSPET